MASAFCSGSANSRILTGLVCAEHGGCCGKDAGWSLHHAGCFVEHRWCISLHGGCARTTKRIENRDVEAKYRDEEVLVRVHGPKSAFLKRRPAFPDERTRRAILDNRRVEKERRAGPGWPADGITAAAPRAGGRER